MARRAGYSLIELLIVAAIIGVLGAVLQPVVVNAKIRGLQTACLYNTKQIAFAIILYTDDNSGVLPLIWTPKPQAPWDSYSSGTMWYDRLQRYTKGGNKNVFKCPAARIRPVNCNYSCNPSMQLGQDHEGRLVTRPWALHEIKSPSRRAFVGDGVPHQRGDYAEVLYGARTVCVGDADVAFRFWSGYPVPDYLNPEADHSDDPRLYSRQIDYRHNNGANFAMLDGHSKWIPRGGLEEYNWWSPSEMPDLSGSDD